MLQHFGPHCRGAGERALSITVGVLNAKLDALVGAGWDLERKAVVFAEILAKVRLLSLRSLQQR